MVPAAIQEMIGRVHWTQWQTAYGCADGVPENLIKLWHNDESVALDATHQLWCGLCHQHAYLSSAALPSFDILEARAKDSSQALSIELADIFIGFIRCSYGATDSWVLELRGKLHRLLSIAEVWSEDSNEDLAEWGLNMIEELTELATQQSAKPDAFGAG